MKNFALIILFTCTLPALSFAAHVNDLFKIEYQMEKAMLRRDGAALDKCMSSDFTFIDECGHLFNKKQFIQLFTSAEMVFRSAKISGMKARTYGNAAVVTGTLNLKGSSGKQDISGAYPFTDTFIRSGGSWAAVASHTSRLTK